MAAIIRIRVNGQYINIPAFVGPAGHSPQITAEKTDGVTTIYVDGEPIANINDGDGQSTGGASSWDDLADKPFERIGNGLKVVGTELQADTAEVVEQDNTLPITSAAVYTEVGNINALLSTI